MSEPIGALRVDVAANVAQIEDDLGKVKSLVNSAAAQMTHGMEAFGKGASKAIGEIFNLRNALIATTAIGLVAFVQKAVNAGDEIAKTAQKIGISTDKLQELRYAAASAGVKTEDFDNALLQLSKRLGENTGEVTETSKALGRLGLTMAELKGKDAADVFAIIADRIGRIPDKMDRARISTDLFGKSGQQLLPVLLTGSKGLAQFAEEARKLGLVLDSSTLKKAEEANDEFTKMSVALRAAGVNVAVGFLPALKELRSVITSPDFQSGVRELAKNFGEFVKWMVDNKDTIILVATAFQGIKMGAAVGGAIGGGRGALLGGALGAGAGLVGGSFLTGGKNDTLDAIKEIEKENQNLAQQQRAIGMEMLKNSDATALGALASRADDLQKKMDENNETLKRLKGTAAATPPTASLTVTPAPGLVPNMPEAEKAMKDLAFQTRIMKGDFDALADGFPALAHGLKIFGDDTYGTFSKAVTKVSELPPQLQALNQKMMEMKGAQLTQEMLEPWEKYAKAVDRVNQLLAAAAISQDTANRKIAEIKFPNLSRLATDAADVNKQLDTMGSTVATSVGDAFTDMVTGAKSASDAFKSLEAAVIRAIFNMIAQMLIVAPIAASLKQIFMGFGLSFGSAPASGGIGSDFVAGGGRSKAPAGNINLSAAAGLSRSIHAQANERRGRGVTVNLFEGAGGDKNRAEHRTGGGGEDIVDLHTRLTQQITSSGKLDKALGGRYGGKPTTLVR